MKRILLLAFILHLSNDHLRREELDVQVLRFNKIKFEGLQKFQKCLPQFHFDQAQIKKKLCNY